MIEDEKRPKRQIAPIGDEIAPIGDEIDWSYPIK